jgi:hypothetical protein
MIRVEGQIQIAAKRGMRQPGLVMTVHREQDAKYEWK